MILWRVLPWDPSARPAAPGGALWFPRPFQGTARHDAPARYGCLYVPSRPSRRSPRRSRRSAAPATCTRTAHPHGPPARARRAGAGRAGATLLDLDDPGFLAAESLRPSAVATRRRALTQAYAARLFDAHPEAAGLRWWSTLEASWICVTLFDRAAPGSRSARCAPSRSDDERVRAAARLLGLAA